MENSKKLDLALLVLRIGLALVFFLFGYQKLSNSAQTTSEIQLLLEFGGIAAAAAINFYLGLLEIIIAGALAFGIKVRLFGIMAAMLTSSFLASFLLKYGTSINPDLYRDVGLAAAGITLGILGGGKFSIRRKNGQQSTPLQK